jgi:hypothetical protein
VSGRPGRNRSFGSAVARVGVPRMRSHRSDWRMGSCESAFC